MKFRGQITLKLVVARCLVFEFTLKSHGQNQNKLSEKAFFKAALTTRRAFINSLLSFADSKQIRIMKLRVLGAVGDKEMSFYLCF